MKSWQPDKAWFWESAPFFRILVPLAAGIVVYDRAWLHIPMLLLIACGSAVCVACFAIIYSGRLSRFHLVSFLLSQALLCICGYGLSHMADVRNDGAWFGHTVRTGSGYMVRVTDEPVEKERSWKVPVSVTGKLSNAGMMPITGDALLYFRKDSVTGLHKGDTLIVPCDWQPVRNSGNPYAFDYVSYCRRSNLFYQQYCSMADIRLYAANDTAAATVIDLLHSWGARQINEHIADPKARSLVQAAILGDQEHMDEETRQAYAGTGIVHIVAISGGNVAVLLFIISAIAGLLRHPRHAWLKYAIAIPVVLLYVVVAGSAASAMRAAVMFVLLAVAVLVQKESNSRNQLFACAFLLLCVQPQWLFSLGFQLSFVAVLSLQLFYTPLHRLLAPKNFLLKAIWSAAAASIAAEVLVAPLVIYYFHMFPLMFLVANVVAGLFIAVVTVGGFIIVLTGFLPVLPSIAGSVLSVTVSLFDSFIIWLRGFSPPSLQQLTLTGWELALLYTFITCIALFLLRKKVHVLMTGLTTACVLLLLFCRNEWLSCRQQRYVVYATPGLTYTERISGHTYVGKTIDMAGPGQLEHASQNAHIGWHANDEDSSAVLNEITSLNGKTLLVLTHAPHTDAHFPVDYLVIDYKGKPDIALLQKLFSPQHMIIGNNYSRRRQAAFAKQAAAMHIPLHTIAGDGAFVMEE